MSRFYIILSDTLKDHIVSIIHNCCETVSHTSDRQLLCMQKQQRQNRFERTSWCGHKQMLMQKYDQRNKTTIIQLARRPFLPFISDSNDRSAFSVPSNSLPIVYPPTSIRSRDNTLLVGWHPLNRKIYQWLIRKISLWPFQIIDSNIS